MSSPAEKVRRLRQPEDRKPPRDSDIRRISVLAEGIEDRRLAKLQKLATVGEISVGLSHDFKNILSVLQGSLEILSMDLEERKLLDDGMVETLAGMERTIKKASETCDRLQRASSMDGNVKVMEVRPLVLSSIEMLKNFIAKTNAEEHKTVEISENVPEGMLAEMIYAEVEMAVLNILINAVEHGIRPGGSVKITINAFQNDEYVFLDISNNGLPVPEAIKESVLEEPLKSHCKNGYGLYISASNLRRFGADILLFESQSRTTFTIVLPVEKQ